MGDKKNLWSAEAIEKIKKLAGEINICMFCTVTDNLPFDTRPMGVQKIDDDGNLWFLSLQDSTKNMEIQAEADVQLIFAQPRDAHFLSVAGKAFITRNQSTIDELWNDYAKAWVKGGKEDPNLTAICVKPTTAYYWDTKYGKMISLFAIAASAISSKEFDTGIEGELTVKK